MQFKAIIGHKALKERLIDTVNDARISHAQLFLGKEGYGSLAIAIAYAQYISCENKLEEDSCGKCMSCIKYEKLVHPDLHFVFPVATNATIKKNPLSENFLQEWRETLLEDHYLTLEKWQDKLATGNKQLLITKDESVAILKKLSLKTYESPYKIMIIWYPERFNTSSANKLLKIIEEPPNKTLFLLVAENTEKIISTILSRTQLVKIRPINEEDLQKEIATKFGLSDRETQHIGRLSQGNFNEARKLITHADKEALYQDIFVKWMRAAFKADIPALIDWTEEISKTTFGREKQKQFLTYGLFLFRESLINNYGDTTLQRRTAEENLFLDKFSPYIHGGNCVAIIDLFNEAIYHIERNANAKILFLDISLKLTKLLRIPQVVKSAKE